MFRLTFVGRLISFGVLLSASVAWAQGPPPAGPPPVTVAKPVMKDVQDQDEFIGRFEGIERVEVRARVQGYLDKVHFTDGALVKAGDLLFTIDQRSYRLAVEQAESTVSNNQARVEFAQTDLDRAEQLRRSGTISGQSNDQRRQNFLTAQADLNGGRAAVADAKLNLEFTEIRSPIAGRISRRLITEGNLIAANTTVLTTIVSVDPIYFYFDIDERSYLAYARMVQQGVRSAMSGASATAATIVLTDATLPARKGELDFVDNRLDDASGTMRMRALVPNKDGVLLPGLFGRISIVGSAPYRAALIPDEAIGTDQDRRIVFVVAPDGTVKSQTVRPGPRQDGYRVIREGLNGDETIVVAGIQRARPGQKVTPREIALPPVRERDAPLPVPQAPPTAAAPGSPALGGAPGSASASAGETRPRATQ